MKAILHDRMRFNKNWGNWLPYVEEKARNWKLKKKKTLKNDNTEKKVLLLLSVI